jgi:hypothetical protein
MGLDSKMADQPVGQISRKCKREWSRARRAQWLHEFPERLQQLGLCSAREQRRMARGIERHPNTSTLYSLTESLKIDTREC